MPIESEVEVFLVDNLITLARSLDQARAILNPHQAAAVRDESTFLQSTGHDADGTCSRAEQHGQKFLSDGA